MNREQQTRRKWAGTAVDIAHEKRLNRGKSRKRDATTPVTPEQPEIARLRAQLAEAQQQRDQMRALLDRLVMTTRELESARPFDEWVDARAKRTEAINAAERVLAALAKESGRWRSRSVISGSTGA